MSDKSYIYLHMCSDAVKRGRLDWEKCLVCESRCGYGKKLLKDKGVGYEEQEKAMWCSCSGVAQYCRR